jgi:uncharacterized protein YbdZ (MbtH family)
MNADKGIALDRGWRYTPDMREYMVSTLVLFCMPCLCAQGVPAGWQIVKDSKNACQLAVPADWSLYGESHSAAVLHDTSTALAVVTSQPGQTFVPLTGFFQKVLNIPKEKLFENTAKRIFYQDKTSKSAEEPNSYTFSVPGKDGTCSGHLTFLPSITEDVARKIALSLGPAS